MAFAIGPGAKPFDIMGKAGAVFLITQDMCHRSEARCVGWLPDHWICAGSCMANFSAHKWKLHNSLDCLTHYQWNEIQTNGISKSGPDCIHMSFSLQETNSGWIEGIESKLLILYAFFLNVQSWVSKTCFAVSCSIKKGMCQAEKEEVEIWRSDEKVYLNCI